MNKISDYKKNQILNDFIKKVKEFDASIVISSDGNLLRQYDSAFDSINRFSNETAILETNIDSIESIVSDVFLGKQLYFMTSFNGYLMPIITIHVDCLLRFQKAYELFDFVVGDLNGKKTLALCEHEKGFLYEIRKDDK